MSFDAQAARALARRSRGAADILTDWKRAIVDAATQGGFAAEVALPDPEPVPTGQSVNTAGFLVEHLQRRGLIAWAEAVQQALNAGYTARPVWRPLAMGAGCEGVNLSWSMVTDAPTGPLQLMSAGDAYRMSMGARAQHQWVEKAVEQVRRAAVQGADACTLHDAVPPASQAWAERRQKLQQMGFTTELLATEQGANLVIRW